MEPNVSVPMAKATSPAAVVEPDPAEDPLDPSSCSICFSFDIDRNQQIEPLLDGLLTLRYLFGY